MKRPDRKYFLVFLVFISLLNPACNHPKQNAATLYRQHAGKHLATTVGVSIAWAVIDKLNFRSL
jgi:hypothetical protein